MGPYDPELRSGADAIAPTVPIDPHYRRVSEIAGTVVASCEEASPDPGAYGPRATSVQGTASIPPLRLQSNCRFSSKVLYSRSSERAAGVWNYRSAVRSAKRMGTDVGRHKKWDRVRDIIAIA